MIRTEPSIEAGDSATAPRLWVHVGRSIEHRTGEAPRRITRWGREIEVGRDARGRLVAVDAATGPAHLPTFESGGIAFVFPHTDAAVPAFSSTILDGMTLPNTRRSVLRTTVRGDLDEMGENAADFAHLHVVHAPVIVGSGPFDAGIEPDGSFVADGFVRVRVGGDVGLRIQLFDPCTSRITVTTPYYVTNLLAFGAQVGPKVTELILVTATPKQWPGFGALTHALTRRNFRANFEQDQPIWSDKVWIDRPVLSDADGPIGVYRRWLATFGIRRDASRVDVGART